MSWFYYVGKAIVKMLLFLLTNWRVKGRENIPDHGPLLVVANHINLADPPIVGVSLGRRVAFMAKEELFRSRFSAYFIRNLGAFPVRRGGLNKEALRKAEQLLAQGRALIMFPEGRRSQGAQLESAFSGSTLIAVRSGVPILPIGIAGTEKIKGFAWLFHRPQITVNIGYPFYLPSVNGKLSRVELAKFTHSVMEHIAELLPNEYRGKYGRQKISQHES